MIQHIPKLVSGSYYNSGGDVGLLWVKCPIRVDEVTPLLSSLAQWTVYSDTECQSVLFLIHKNNLTMFGMATKNYTVTSPSRSYGQRCLTWLPKEKTGTGNIFSQCRFFGEYAYTEHPVCGEFEEVQIDPSTPAVNKKLVSCITETIGSNSRIVIEVPLKNDDDVRGNNLLRFPPIKGLLLAFDALHAEVRSACSILAGPDIFEFTLPNENPPTICLSFGYLHGKIREWYKDAGYEFRPWSDFE